MDRKATMTACEPVREVHGDHGLRGLAHDMVCLTELQAKLLKVDSQSAVNDLVRPLIACGAASVLALGTLPVALSIIGLALAEFAEWPLTAGFAVAALVGFGSAAAIGLWAWMRWRNRQPFFARSQAELAQNVERIKGLLSRAAMQTTEH